MLKTVNILNKRARFDYEIIETYTAGIVLAGTEIKSIRLGKANITITNFLPSILILKNTLLVINSIINLEANVNYF